MRTGRLTLLFFVLPMLLFAQTGKMVLPSHYAKVFYVKSNRNVKSKGVLYSMTDSTVIIADKIRQNQNSHFDTIPVTQIKRICFHKRGSVGTGVLIGTGASVGAGLISFMFASDDEFLGRGIYLFAGVVFAIPASLVGGVIGGSVCRNFYVDFDINKFKAYKSQLLERTYLK